MPLFPPYETVVDLFYRAGGVTLISIRSPRRLLDEFKASFPIDTAQEVRYLGAPVELADVQDMVSVRGISTAGHEFEYPEP